MILRIISFDDKAYKVILVDDFLLLSNAHTIVLFISGLGLIHQVLGFLQCILNTVLPSTLEVALRHFSRRNEFQGDGFQRFGQHKIEWCDSISLCRWKFYAYDNAYVLIPDHGDGLIRTFVELQGLYGCIARLWPFSCGWYVFENLFFIEWTFICRWRSLT